MAAHAARALALAHLLLVVGCASLPPIARPATITDNLGPAGALGAPAIAGPHLWLGGEEATRLLAVDPTGFRAAVTDGRQVLIWDGVRGRVERLLPWSGQVVRGASFEPGGRLLALHEHQSELRPYLARLRLIDLTEGRDLSHVELPCGCLIDYAFDHDGQRLLAVVSSDAYDGTWLLSWSVEGEVLGGARVSREVLDSGDAVRFYVDAAGRDRLLVFRSGGRGGEEIVHVDADALEVLERRTIHANDLGVPCGVMALPCSQAVTVDPERGHLLVATGIQGGSTRLTAWPLADAPKEEARRAWTPSAEWIAAWPAPRWNARRPAFAPEEAQAPRDAPRPLREVWLEGFVPFSWVPRPEGGWSLMGHAGASRAGGDGWRLMRFAPGDEVTLEAEWEALPTAPLLRFEESWVSVHQTRLFRGAFRLPEPSEAVQRELAEARWYANGSRAATHPVSGERLFASLDGAWVWPRGGRPSFLPGVNVANAVALMPGRRRPGPSGVDEPRVLRSTGTAVEQSAYAAPGFGSGGVLATPVTRWEPLRGFVREVLALEQDRLLTLTRVDDRRVELEVLEAPDGARPRSIATAQARLADTRYAWRLVAALDRSQAAVVSLTDDAETGHHTLDVITFSLPGLERVGRRSVDLGREDVWLETHRDCGDLLLYTRGSVLRLSAWEPEATPEEATWFPASWGWIKGVVPMGGGVVAVRAVRQELPSSEWWVWLDLSDARHRVLGHRAFHDAVAWASWPTGREVDVLESSGRVTRLRLTPGGRVEVVGRALLHASQAVYIELDGDGRVRLPREARGRAAARRWLEAGVVTPLVVDGRGRAAP